jgi:hypothetical protein
MYEVKYFEFEDPCTETELTLFRSAYQVDCWAFVRNHLTCHNPIIKKRAKFYVVMDSQRQCLDPSMDVILLRKFAA